MAAGTLRRNSGRRRMLAAAGENRRCSILFDRKRNPVVSGIGPTRRIGALALAGMAWVWVTFLLLLGFGAVAWAVGADQAMAVGGGDRVLLAADERQWLRLHDGNIRIGITVIPPQVLQGERGFEGLSIDYIRLLERKLGCRFELVPFTTWNEVIAAAKDRRIDMIFAAQETPERRQYLLFTEAYIDLPNMIVMRKEREGGAALKAMDGWKVATSKGSAVQEYLKKEFPRLALCPVPDELTGLRQVSLGEVDAMVVELSRASYYIEKEKILNLRVAGEAGLVYRLRFAVRSDWPLLQRILNRGLADIRAEEKREIQRRWIIIGDKSLFSRREVKLALLVGLGVVVGTIAAFLVWTWTLRRMVAQRTAQLQQELAERRRAEQLFQIQTAKLEQEVSERKKTQEELQEQTVLLEEEGGRHRETQEKLERLNVELEQRIQGRTAELCQKNAELQQAYDELKETQSRLLQQEKMASIGQLAAGVAHEINNPTGFILSNLNTLGKYARRLLEFQQAQSEVIAKLVAVGGGGSDAVENLAALEKSLKIQALAADIDDLVSESIEGGERVKEIVQNLKSFARMDGNEVKSADLNLCLESTLNIVWNELKYNCTVLKDYGDIPQILCNPSQLNQVFMNLLVNAAQAIAGQGEISITTRQENGFVVVTIADTGCGIAAEKLSRVFEPFYTTKAVGKGTGLGLSISYDIVKKHHGEISVESEVGRGTRFLIRLPVKQEQEAVA